MPACGARAKEEARPGKCGGGRSSPEQDPLSTPPRPRNTPCDRCRREHRRRSRTRSAGCGSTACSIAWRRSRERSSR